MTGIQLKRIRVEKKITQEDLGRQVGKTQQEIYRYEKGIVRIPADMLPALASALEVDISEFFNQNIITVP